MKTNQFENKVCWVTGASSGIGAALALELNTSGAILILSGRNEGKLKEVRDACMYPENIQILSFDMEVTRSLTSVAAQAWNLLGGIDYVFLNAGMAVRDMIAQTDLDMVEKVMNINFISNVVIAKALLPQMLHRKSGCFVVTSSLCGKFGVPKLGAYSASKHALHGFFDSLRVEYQHEGIKVTMIVSGFVKTNITLHALKGNGNSYGRMQDAVGAGISPEQCARQMLKAVARGKCEALTGSWEKYSVLVKRFFPGLQRIMITKHPMKMLKKLKLLNPMHWANYIGNIKITFPNLRF